VLAAAAQEIEDAVIRVSADALTSPAAADSTASVNAIPRTKLENARPRRYRLPPVLKRSTQRTSRR